MPPFPPDTPDFAPAAPTWLTRFDAFGPFHAVALGSCLAIIIVWCALGRRLRALDTLDGGRREPRARTGVALLFLAWQGFATAWRLLPGQFDLHESLPLHLCRLAGVIAPVALLTLDRRARALTFFWGLGLSTQGYLTPMWHDGLATVAFWLYWAGHTVIVGSAVYDLAVLGYRPGARDLGFAVALGVAVTVAIALLNLALGTNYCYLGRADYAGTSVADLLGDWPVRPIAIITLAAGFFAVMHALSRLLPAPRRPEPSP